MAAERSDEVEGGERRGEDLVVLFEQLEGPLLGYAGRLLRDPAMAEDIVQEAFLKLQEQAREVRERRSWLYRTVHNLSLNHLRSRNRLVPIADGAEGAEGGREGEIGRTEDPADLEPLPDEQLLRWEGIGLVRLGLQNLDSRSREVVRLKFEENLSYRDISVRTGLTSGHVGYLLHHALKALADDLARSGLLP